MLRTKNWDAAHPPAGPVATGDPIVRPVYKGILKLCPKWRKRWLSAFSLCPEMFKPYSEQISNFLSYLSSANPFNLDQSIDLSFDKD